MVSHCVCLWEGGEGVDDKPKSSNIPPGQLINSILCIRSGPSRPTPRLLLFIVLSTWLPLARKPMGVCATWSSKWKTRTAGASAPPADQAQWLSLEEERLHLPHSQVGALERRRSIPPRHVCSRLGEARPCLFPLLPPPSGQLLSLQIATDSRSHSDLLPTRMGTFLLRNVQDPARIAHPCQL